MNVGDVGEYLLVGLTGSIGAGKSTVADIFRKEGIPVLSADQIAKDLMNEDPVLREEIIAILGTEAYKGDLLDRQYMASKIFQDRDLLEKVNEAVHPRTIAAQGVEALKLVAAGHRVVVCEAALIFETDGEERFDYIVVVDAPQQERLERAAVRDGTSIDAIERREENQMPAEEKVKRADFVLKNDGSLKDLERNTLLISSLLKVLPPRTALEEQDEPEGEEEV